MQDEPNLADAIARRRWAALSGHLGDEAAARRAQHDEDGGVRATALGALARLGVLCPADVIAALADESPVVRRRAIEGAVACRLDATSEAIRQALGEAEASVVEVAAWALGELGPPAAATVEALASTAGHHRDPLCREAAVAALGALGDPAGLAAILAATHDKPAIRRRAVLALAPFDGPEVEAALAAALHDRDWQVRQAAEDLGAAGAAGGDVPPEHQ